MHLPDELRRELEQTISEASRNKLKIIIRNILSLDDFPVHGTTVILKSQIVASIKQPYKVKNRGKRNKNSNSSSA